MKKQENAGCSVKSFFHSAVYLLCLSCGAVTCRTCEPHTRQSSIVTESPIWQRPLLYTWHFNGQCYLCEKKIFISQISVFSSINSGIISCPSQILIEGWQMFGNYILRVIFFLSWKTENRLKCGTF